MPRQRKPARLWLRERNGTKSWIILDGGKQYPTGCSDAQTELAERKLSEHSLKKYSPDRKVRDIEQIPVADVLSVYWDYKGNDEFKQQDPAGWRRLKGRIRLLAGFFGRLMLSDINGDLCRAYVTHRGRTGGARRELQDLRAAIGHHQAEGRHRGIVKVKLPPKGEARDRWLTRDEAAKLLWTCWRHREKQTRFGEAVGSKKRPLRHLARFILLGLYTGTRAGALASASWHRGTGRSYIDLERGVFFRLAEGKRATNKRQPPVRLPDHLLAHLRRWARTPRRDGTLPEYVVEFRGQPVRSVKNGFSSAVELAGLEEGASPHVLRHTAATWLMQAGCDVWQASGFLGMSPKILTDVYGHHHPDFQTDVAKAFRKRVSLAETLPKGKKQPFKPTQPGTASEGDFH